ncbi:MAG TPA: acetyl-CoA acetyltransferase [Actinomycetota bacterium]|nr:acetyl-CoA acetyltransferase [Actinomycetota bacterium]
MPDSDRVAVVGVGLAGFAPITAGISYKELTFEAAQRAYADAGVDARQDIDSFVTVAEDFLEGTSIFDEYTPDQMGAAQRPMQTITADGLFGLATGVMLIRSGIADIVAIEGHSKVSDVLTLDRIIDFAQDPVLNRPLGLHPSYVAGLEMRRWMTISGATEKQVAEVVVKNRRNALDNPTAAYPAALSVDQVLASPPVAEPLRSAEVAGRADGAIVLVLASEKAVKRLGGRAVWVTGVGWSQDAPSLESRSWSEATYLKLAAERAYALAGIKQPQKKISVAEVNDTYAYKELQHLEALGLAGNGLPVNVSGGCLGRGNLFEANGLAQAAECVAQLRGETGKRQVKGASAALAASWRGVPSSTGAVAIFEA